MQGDAGHERETKNGQKCCAASALREDAPLILRFFMIHNMTMRIGDRLTSPHGLTSARWMILCTIGEREEPPTLSELSADAMLSLQNVSRMVTLLEKEGHLERFNKLGAGRAVFVRLTDKGRRAQETLHTLGDHFDTRFLHGVTPKAQAALAQQLDHLIANLESFEHELDSTTTAAQPTGRRPGDARAAKTGKQK